MLVVLNVVYVLIAIAMVALILMQRGAGAQAGSGFGAGASATVFGATGAGNFLSKATKWLAIVFFTISMYMAWHATNTAVPQAATQADLGIMAEVPAAPADDAAQVPTAPAGLQVVPEAPAQDAAAAEATVPAEDAAAETAEPAPQE